MNTKLFDSYALSGKTALITGASSGLGEQFARCLSSAGARVILTARRIEKLHSLANELKNAVAIQMDVTDKTSVEAAFKKIEELEERIEICVNNAGIFYSTPVFESDEQNNFESVMQTNVMGVWYVTKAVANHMKNHSIQGSIINISSVNGADFVKTQRAGYCASKAAVIQMTKALVSELASVHIRINCIVPGAVHTPATHDRLKTETLRKEVEAEIPLKFIANPSDLDGTLLYLASNSTSRYVTGSCITCDGGISWGNDMVLN